MYIILCEVQNVDLSMHDVTIYSKVAFCQSFEQTIYYYIKLKCCPPDRHTAYSLLTHRHTAYSFQLLNFK